MKYIYSKQDPSKLLHSINRFSEIQAERTDLVTSDHFIQCSSLKLPNHKTFRPHQHIWKKGPERVIAQESWVVISGSVKCDFFDTDGVYLTSVILKKGDASFTFEGGHNYLSLEEDTIVYEYKTGPYEGQLLDKKFLGE